MKYCSFLIPLVLLSCNQNKPAKESGGIVNDTIPQVRQMVKTQPIASYSEKTKDKLNNWRFAVDLYETSETFKFIAKIEYETLNTADTITIPNFGIQPVVEVQKGEEPLSCIIGFQDKKGAFMKYKEVSVKNKQLKIATIQRYARTRFRKKSS